MCIFLWILLSFPQQNDDINTVTHLLILQQSSWNKGDIDGYMTHYWKSENLTFVTKDTVTYGWQPTLDRYKRRYPNKQAMGKLNFEIVKTEKLSAQHIFMVGKWALDRKDLEDLQGHFTLIWKKIDGDWVIVADHSS